MGVKLVEAYGDSLLVVQQVSKVCQCLDEILNAYLDKCLDIITSFDEFVIYHVPRVENPRANALAQQASDYDVRKKELSRKEADVLRSRGVCSGIGGPTAWYNRSDRHSRSNCPDGRSDRRFT